MTSLAGYLCATVYAPPPTAMVRTKHITSIIGKCLQYPQFSWCLLTLARFVVVTSFGGSGCLAFTFAQR